MLQSLLQHHIFNQEFTFNFISKQPTNMMRVRLAAAIAAVLFVAMSEATVRPGKCPNPYVMKIACDGSRPVEGKDCRSDDQCSGSKKCCLSPCGWNECFPQEALPPPTFDYDGCPAYIMIACDVDKPKLCDSTTKCAFGEKCCPVGCNGMQCVPAGPKEGLCANPMRELVDCRADAMTNSKAECAFDYQCGENRKCCEQACVKPLCVAPIKNGTCPVTAQGCPSGQNISNKCTEDFNCTGSQKCCSSGCGLRCMLPDVPVVVKQGQCPMHVMGCPGPISTDNGCGHDGHCDGSLKCCSTACNGLQCQLPQEEPDTIKAGECKPVNWAAIQCMAMGESEEEDDCDKDGECPGDAKCCDNPCTAKRCLLPAQCPYYDDNRKCFVASPSECTVGEKCANGRSCCKYECGGSRCEPELCPGVNPNINCITKNKQECNDTNQCGPNAICCSYECSGRKCVPRDAPAHSGYCPDYTGIKVKCPAVVPRNECSSDEQCYAGKKCCTRMCGGLGCIDTVSTPPPKPVCPIYNKNADCTTRRGAYMCNNPGRACTAGGLCCNSECGGTSCQTGLCAAPKDIQCVMPETRECETSSTCFTGKVCCEIHCGGSRCSAPVGSDGAVDGGKPSDTRGVVASPAPICPKPTLKAPCSESIKNRACSSDADCNGRRCCESGCGVKVCQTPVRPGTCPKPEVRCMAPQPQDKKNKCGTDMSCPGNQKCCESPCLGWGRSCMDPVV